MPQLFGNGLAMRAASVLEALARSFDVYLFVVPVAGDLGPPSDFVRTSAARIGGLDLAANLDPLFALIARVLDPEARVRAELAYAKPYLSRFCTGDSARSVFEWSRQFPIEAIHVMRLYLAPLALPFLQCPVADRPFCVLDLDDDDARSCRRLMRLHSDSGNGRAAAVAGAEADKYQTLADGYLAAFDRVIVCSETDASRLAERFSGAHFSVVPNGYRPTDLGRWRRPSNCASLRLLFVGTLGYFPNADAVLFLCQEVLPALRRLTDREVRIDLVGADNGTVPSEVRAQPEVTLHGFVENLTPLYAAADVAAVAVRSGPGCGAVQSRPGRGRSR